MATVSKKKINRKSILNGLSITIQKEFSVRLIIGGSIITLVLAFFLGCNALEWAFLVLFLGGMLGIELMNTTIEAVVDLKSPEFHPLAKIAKDTASAAEGVFASLSVLGIFLLLIPKIMESITWW